MKGQLREQTGFKFTSRAVAASSKRWMIAEN
jgi:hypothetical protein